MQDARLWNETERHGARTASAERLLSLGAVIETIPALTKTPLSLSLSDSNLATVPLKGNES